MSKKSSSEYLSLITTFSKNVDTLTPQIYDKINMRINNQRINYDRERRDL